MGISVNLIATNRYAKMQEQAMPVGSESITFDDVVPKMASSRHVAAAGFYHCLGEKFIRRLSNAIVNRDHPKLVLATKDLLKVEQKQPYKTILLKVLGN
jgi:folate-dependent phosphoribosylglycinamide formyltransferase PurN